MLVKNTFSDEVNSKNNNIDIQNSYIQTTYVNEEILKCEDVDDLKKYIFPLLKSQKEEWGHKMNSIMNETGYAQAKFGRLSGVSRQSVGEWIKGGIPKSRNHFIQIGLAANYDLERMDQLLQRYGRYPGLYSKSLEDCVCKFVINQNYGEENLEKYNLILRRIKDKIFEINSNKNTNTKNTNTKNTNTKNTIREIVTEVVDKRLSSIKTEDELEQFIIENSIIFQSAYQNLYNYITNTIDNNLQRKRSGSVFQMSLRQEWSSSLKHCVSAIEQKKWYPTRDKIISLGLHLSMDCEQINTMLELAHMEPLYAKNIFESVIIFILEDAALNNLMDEADEMYSPEDLCYYAKEVFDELEMPEFTKFMKELPEETNNRE